MPSSYCLCCICGYSTFTTALTCKRGAWERHGLIQGDTSIAPTQRTCVTQDYKTAMRARGGTGEAIDIRTLVLVLRYLNQSHGEFVKNSKGNSQTITYTDRKVRLATHSSNEP